MVTCLSLLIRLLGVILAIWGTYSYLGPNYPIDLISMTEGSVFAGVAWHCYGGNPSAMTKVAEHFAFRAQPLEHHVTECSGGGWSGSFADELIWTQKNVYIGSAHNYGSSVLRWNLALDEFSGPHCSGGSCCSDCRGVVTIPSDAESIENVTFNVEFYGLAHHSALLEPGAQHIFSHVDGKASGESIHAVAYRNPSGIVVLVALNEDYSDNQTLVVEDRSRNGTFEFLLPPGVATFAWDPLT